jgi:hypothetical protein
VSARLCSFFYFICADPPSPVSFFFPFSFLTKYKAHFFLGGGAETKKDNEINALRNRAPKNRDVTGRQRQRGRVCAPVVQQGPCLSRDDGHYTYKDRGVNEVRPHARALPATSRPPCRSARAIPSIWSCTRR